MKRFVHGKSEIWVGVHSQMGIFIYDPAAQACVAPDKVRLYVWSERRMARFLKSIVRDRLSEEDSEAGHAGPLQKSAEFYFQLRERFTNCYRCAQDLNSIDFDLCPVCRWIKCPCGACGCRYHR
jgi:hypothetical protein